MARGDKILEYLEENFGYYRLVYMGTGNDYTNNPSNNLSELWFTKETDTLKIAPNLAWFENSEAYRHGYNPPKESLNTFNLFVKGFLISTYTDATASQLWQERGEMFTVASGESSEEITAVHAGDWFTEVYKVLTSKGCSLYYPERMLELCVS